MLYSTSNIVGKPYQVIFENMKAIHVIAFILVIVGAINWGLFGLFGLDVVTYLGATLAKVVYILVGVSGLVLIFTHKKDCKSCESKPEVTPAA